jgi:hypothetical protein
MATTNGGATAPSTSMTVATERGFRLELEPKSINDLLKMAAELSKIQLCGVTSPQEAMARMLTGRELGLSMMQSIRGVYIVEGRPSLDASLMQAVCMQQPECEYFDIVELTDTQATAETKRRGRPAQRFTFTIEDAKRAGLVDRGADPKKNNWNKYPKQMLMARAKSNLARMVYPGALFGMYTPDEMHDGAIIEVRTVADDQPAQRDVHTAERDVEAECAAIETAIREASTKEQRTAARKSIELFAADVGEPWAERLKSLYNEMHAKKAPTAADSGADAAASDGAS